ncbi:MAG: histidine--tRNA ligase, partial [Synergistaceae bacterium]|nr:histidine--tRNA ligase [Synergistaceae bacterium]
MDMIKAPRGTKDVLGDESWKWSKVLKVCEGVAQDFGYAETLLPIF